MNESSLRPFRRENIPAYLAVMGLWVAASVVSALVLALLSSGALAFGVALAWAAATCMTGMTILFVASLLNMFKMRRGFQRLAEGDPRPDIPPVWCPVLTMATQAALDVAQKCRSKAT